MTDGNMPLGDRNTPKLDDVKTPKLDDGTGKAQSKDEQNHCGKTLTKDDPTCSGNSAMDPSTNSDNPPPESPQIGADVILNVLPELCEFAPLDFLLQQLPRKAQRAQRALSAITVEFTCLDVNKDFIVLGANFSMVFVYDRRKNTIIKLRCDVRLCCAVKIL